MITFSELGLKYAERWIFQEFNPFMFIMSLLILVYSTPRQSFGNHSISIWDSGQSLLSIDAQGSRLFIKPFTFRLPQLHETNFIILFPNDLRQLWNSRGRFPTPTCKDILWSWGIKHLPTGPHQSHHSGAWPCKWTTSQNLGSSDKILPLPKRKILMTPTPSTVSHSIPHRF